MTSPLTTVRVVGGLLPTDVIAAVLGNNLAGLTSSDYHLGGESPREAAARIWTHLLGVHRRFRDDLARLPEDDAAVGVTRERWLMVLLSELGYGRVPLTPAGGLTVGDKTYPVSHLWGATPIHLLGWGVPLDKRSPGVAGAALRAPHAMLQEELNRADEHLWAILANGRVLRLLRDSTTLTGQSYVEFDLEAMFDGEVFSDFVALFLLCHESRVEVPEGGAPADCRLEQWRTTAVSQGVRALSLLRDGVQRALEVLGTGFLQHPANADLRDNLASGAIRLDDLHQSLLRTVYRLLFWAVAEDRGALLDPAADAFVFDRYRSHFSSARLRSLAVRRHGSAHDDLWQGVDLVLAALGRAGGEPRLGLPGLGGLFAVTEADVLLGCRLPNAKLLSVVRDVSVVQPKGQARRHVDFRNLGAEELGSIYESLLELVPRHDPSTHVFSLQMLAGNDRKTSGSYYTPTALVELVLDTALDPVLDVAEKQENPELALLALKVCDPAMGSGHFIVAAARRIATRVATLRTGEIDPTPTTLADAMHDVVARCIYGVDLNPMAADLAKVSLWLEAMSPGRPLSFLDHHIKVGNALLGTTPALLHAGIPDSAFVALTGDDKPTVKAWKKLNEFERSGQGSFFDDGGLDLGNEALRKDAAEVAVRAENAHTLADIAWAAQRYNDATHSDEAVRRRRTADAWCAAFLSIKIQGAPPITQAGLNQIAAGTASTELCSAVATLATHHRLFHWHLEFPEVFQVDPGQLSETPSGWAGGFNAVLGNPPWISYSGRQAVYLDPRVLRLATSVHPAGASWPSSQGYFLIAASRLASIYGQAALLLPFQVALLDSYAPVRSELTGSRLDLDVHDCGEGTFIGVSQRTGIFALKRSSAQVGSVRITPLAESRPRFGSGFGQETEYVDKLVSSLASYPPFPKSTFGDPGIHTGNVSKKIISRRFDPSLGSRLRPVREGKDILPYRCLPPRMFVDTNPLLEDGEYCRIGTEQTYRATPIILRQTASRPIAAIHEQPTYFRNSILACFGSVVLPSRVLVAILNSEMVGVWYKNQVLDAQQRAFPQVKVGALRKLPAPPQVIGHSSETISQLDVEIANLMVSKYPDAQTAVRIEGLVCDLYELSVTVKDFLCASAAATVSTRMVAVAS